jgi:hypothetical protein
VIAVASGKGGVGKSSLTVNLAARSPRWGGEVGMLDADIYGHSIPHMLGIHQKPVVVDKMIVPPVAHDLKLMSIGFFLDDNQPVMWRGPMLHRALEQFLQDVHWGELDVLVVDMPPGTGDVSISLGQLLPRAEAVVVTTPQLLAQEVASRAATMAQKTGHALLGVIENMTSEVFGSGGGSHLAEELGVPLLGSARSRSTQASHGLARIEWLESWEHLDTEARPERVVAEPEYERWDGAGALGYLTLAAVVRAQLAAPPSRARLVVCSRTFPTGTLGYWARQLAEGGLVALLTATSPRRLPPPGGGEPLTGTNPLAIAIPSSDGGPVVTDVSMGSVTHGDVLAGRARPEELVPFGGPQAHKAFALAVGLQLFVDALNPDDGFGAVLLVARAEADPVPGLRELALGVRLPGDRT